MCVAWALDHREPFDPLIIFSRGSVLYIYDIQRKGISGYIRGHGGVRRILDKYLAYPSNNKNILIGHNVNLRTSHNNSFILHHIEGLHNPNIRFDFGREDPANKRSIQGKRG